ncbi:hypothetical protein Vretimale_3083 [Volvox reticuliferus]|uniref:Phosphatidic acid phosphatase type 2/haloperoxidase domain-containing protein n=1 Tax=Volvox reticuliferus TaxID=1737510 RepID=A0A8J4CEP6_9CHLO|nr:hypothetical protein Vretifemale_6731 [Volvox reticuliferus]GIL97434.1 hypothetical protein Vretimale_3083 [Volvox reticuliferus]
MTSILDNALALPGAALFGVCLLAKIFTPRVRRSFGRRVYNIAYRQHEGVARLQKRLRHPLLDLLSKFTALTVSVEFYLLALPPLMWLAGQHGVVAGLAICQCMALSTYMTCVMKDMLSSPRPYMFFRTCATKLSAPPDTAPATAAAVQATVATVTANAPPKDAVATVRAAAAVNAIPTPLNGAATVANADLSAGRHIPAETAEQCQSGKAYSAPPTQFVDRGLGGPTQVAVIEDAYRSEIEYGAPSMHTWCALVLPAYAGILAHQLGALSALQCAAVVAGAGCWATWVALTRLYLGVHTPVDLLLGALGGCASLGFWRQLGLAQIAALGATVPATEEVPWASWLGFYKGQHYLALAAVGGLYVTALATYPVPESHTTSYEYAVIFLGAAYGGLIGCTANCSLVSHLLQRLVTFGNAAATAGGGGNRNNGGPVITAAEALAAVAPDALRQPVAVVLLGFVFVAAVKLLSKAMLSELLPKLLDLVPLRLRLLWQPPVHPSGCVESKPKYARHGHKKTETVVTRAESGEGSPTGPPPKLQRRQSSVGRGVFMKTPTLPYDVDFLRKFLNYGITVYAVIEYRHVAALLLGERSQWHPSQ